MKKPKIKTREVPKIQYYVYCPLCNHEIIGNSVTQVEYNISKHLEKCEKNKKEENKK